MVNNINNFGVINFYENNATKQESSKKEQVIEDIQPSKKEQVYKPTIPKEGDYNEVREYIKLRKQYDEDFRTYWDGHSLKQNCAYLSKEFKWLVDEHSLGANLNRHR